MVTLGFCTFGLNLGPLYLLFISPLLVAFFNDICQGFITLLDNSMVKWKGVPNNFDVVFKGAQVHLNVLV